MDSRSKGALLLPRLAAIAEPTLRDPSPHGAGRRFCRKAPAACRAMSDLIRGAQGAASRVLTVFPVLEMLGLAGLIFLLAR